jgi:alpha-L-fucosidase
VSASVPIPQWFAGARLGMFIHWSHCSQRGLDLSWPLVGGVGAIPSGQTVGVAEYHSTAATFNPVKFDARAWARLARRAGMRYAVLTSKHHDGYALFHTRLSDWSIEHSPFRRDIVADYAAAFRAEGLKVGLYFSLIDWHHPDYPPFEESDKPYRFGQWRRPSAEQWKRYLEFMFGQVRELLTNYGRIDLLWFDGGWERTAEEWRADELVRMIRQLQPDIVINDRLPGHGDYETPEQFVPAKPPGRAWETCMTINRSWGYNPSDRRLKSSARLIQTICETAGRGGNLLLNVSPTADGTLPPEQVERLEAIASWMERNAESIHDTEPGLEPWQFYGPSTRRGNRVYLHLLMRPYDEVTVRGLPVKRVKSVHALGHDAPLRFHSTTPVVDALLNNPDPVGELRIEVPAEALRDPATVIAIDL